MRQMVAYCGKVRLLDIGTSTFSIPPSIDIVSELDLFDIAWLMSRAEVVCS
jgi:hypothetical protein